MRLAHRGVPNPIRWATEACEWRAGREIPSSRRARCGLPSQAKMNRTRSVAEGLLSPSVGTRELGNPSRAHRAPNEPNFKPDPVNQPRLRLIGLSAPGRTLHG